ncbi:MAG: hypothetical protein VZR76_05270 [Candidatus Enteromonas sp.]|jgi:hypothetical protein|nr:hypothetical protein [Candidatus Enteromonas sp.]MEE3427079.1 hypothetical protein [Candidatus Enteromonas sp.]MEE3431419.1 hypothetical protein [Candidatus Enteromonas sp.]
MEDKSSVIFGNAMPKKLVKKANKTKAKNLKKYGDDTNKEYCLGYKEIPTLKSMGVQNIVLDEKHASFKGKPLIVGNIRMGFGHYRISIAMASCAKALGYDPYWLDLASFDATGSKWIREQNKLYSMGSKLSQKSKLFNKLLWEPLNSEGFKKITYNVGDQKNTELLVPLFHNIPKDTPYIATHVWPSQAAIHAGMTHVVNAIPDNWPMGLHLSEGAIHTVQTPFAYVGYKTFDGFDKKPLKGMKDEDLKLVGCYVDHELVVNCEKVNEERIKRLDEGRPIRILMTVGGAGAGYSLYKGMIEHLLPYVKENKVMIMINFGDHQGVYNKLKAELKGFETVNLFNEYDKVEKMAKDLEKKDLTGIYAICNEDIFQAVYSTNLLMNVSDLLITKPSELVYYPIPKLFMRHIGGHEVYGGIYGREMGDAVKECPDEKSMNKMLDYLVQDRDLIKMMCKRIVTLKQAGFYNGAYECVKLAVEGRK